MDVSKMFSYYFIKNSKNTLVSILCFCLIITNVRLDGHGAIDYSEHGGNWNGTCSTVLFLVLLILKNKYREKGRARLIFLQK